METLYKSEDGKLFANKVDCVLHESKIKNKIDYFKVLCDPDLNKSGQYQKIIYVEVFDKPEGIDDPESIVLAYALHRFKNLLVKDVHGDIKLNFSISKIDAYIFEREYFKQENPLSEQIILTQHDFGELLGYNFIINYMDFIK